MSRNRLHILAYLGVIGAVLVYALLLHWAFRNFWLATGLAFLAYAATRRPTACDATAGFLRRVGHPAATVVDYLSLWVVVALIVLSVVLVFTAGMGPAVMLIFVVYVLDRLLAWVLRLRYDARPRRGRVIDGVVVDGDR